MFISEEPAVRRARAARPSAVARASPPAAGAPEARRSEETPSVGTTDRSVSS